METEFEAVSEVLVFAVLSRVRNPTSKSERVHNFFLFGKRVLKLMKNANVKPLEKMLRMKTLEDLTKEQLINDLVLLRQQISELEEIGKERAKYEEELNRTKAMFEGLFEFAPDAILVVSQEGHIVRANKQAVRLFGYLENEMTGIELENLLPERFREKHKEHRQRYMADPHVRPMGRELELYGRRKDGSEFRVDIALGPIRIEQEHYVLAVIRDFTERKRLEQELAAACDSLEIMVKERTAKLELANEKLRSIPSKLIEVQENERKRLASELHDSVGQTLAALKFRIEHISVKLRDGLSEEAMKLINEFVPIMQRSIDETRTIYMGLRPPLLADQGIVATLEWYRKELMMIYPKIHIELETEVREEDISGDIKTAMFRIIQEALNNSCKHSGAEWVDVRLFENNGVIELEISDDGIGMDMEFIITSSKAKSFGLFGMRERAELTGGKLTIISAPGEGTAIRAVWRNNSINLLPGDSILVDNN